MQPLTLSLSSSSTASTNKHRSNTRSSIAKQIRDIQRLLKLDSLGADARVELDRKLKTLLQTSRDSKAYTSKLSAEKSHMEKYRMIKFFEKKKALKKLKSVLRVKSSQDEIDKAKWNLNYVVHFPKDKKYISLYPNLNTEPSSSTLQAKEIIMADIKSHVLSGKLPDAECELHNKNESLLN